MNNRHNRGSYYFDDNLFAFFNRLNKDFETLFNQEEVGFSCPSFPPANVYVDEDKNITYELAVSGYKKEDISISFESDYMMVEFKKPKEEKEKEEDKKIKRIYHKLKLTDTKQKYYLPNDKFDYDSAKAELNDGILTISINSKEPKRRILKLS